MVYEECLVVGQIYPYSLSDVDETAQEVTGCDLPTVALLQVSKTIRREAEPLLYQRNHFLLGRAEISRRFFERCLNTPTRKLWFKSVIMWLKFDDHSRADRKAILDTELGLAREFMLFPERVYSQQVPWEEKLHDAYKKHLGEIVWPQKLLPLLDYCSLSKLVLYISRAVCHTDCCAMSYHAVLSFRKGFAMGFPTHFVIGGLGNGKAASEKLIRSWTARRLTVSDRKLVHDIFPDEGPDGSDRDEVF